MWLWIAKCISGYAIAIVSEQGPSSKTLDTMNKAHAHNHTFLSWKYFTLDRYIQCWYKWMEMGFVVWLFSSCAGQGIYMGNLQLKDTWKPFGFLKFHTQHCGIKLHWVDIMFIGIYLFILALLCISCLQLGSSPEEAVLVVFLARREA